VRDRLDAAPLLLYAAGIAWTLVYDTIYAHQDKEDDALIGVRSTALKFGAASRIWLVFFAVAMLLLLAAMIRRRASALRLGGARRGRGSSAWQIFAVDFDDPADCLAKFRANRWLGWILFIGIILGRVLAGRLAERSRVFIRAETVLAAPPLVPEIQLYLASEILPIWHATEADLERNGLPPPYWAFAWPGGQALTRHLLDHPDLVAGRRVLDFAAGSGLTAIAAAMAGASAVSAAEIDPFARMAIALNAAANGVRSR
jgi:Predicted methyltransferase